ncbi:RDD family protein [Streptomyces exfoliatus]|uniref:RDD family protein n=1 Tax=Streptomyces exfoliatus TaxID=1905 RepID=UPI0004CDD4B8|nr:RDD family protein [Streptomyces exfoliatus]
MATPPGGGGEVPQAGYYPDPSIPGYIRYWNGGAWVPGTSRPAPKEDEVPPGPPASAIPAGPLLASSPAPAPVPVRQAEREPEREPEPEPVQVQAPVRVPAQAPAPAPVPAVEETGPVFFDEEPAAQEPASAWQADTSRQTGFGGDRDQKVSWGAPRTADPRTPADWPVAGASEPADARAHAAPQTADPRKAEPRSAEPRNVDHRTAGGAARLGGMPVMPIPTPTPTPAPAPTPTPVQQAPAPAPVQRTPAPAPVQQTPAPTPASAPAPASAPTPVQQAPAPAPATPSWAQQPQQPQLQQVQPQSSEQQQPVVPWKPPVDDLFVQAAREQASARPAGLGRRLLARLIDTVVLGALVGGASFPFVTTALDHIDGKIEAAKQSGVTVQVWLLDGTTSVQFGIALAALFVIGILYEVVPTSRWGRTLGKKLCGIEVRDIEAHQPPRFGASLRRWLVYSVLGLLAIGVFNVLWCLFDRPWRQCWHDKAARTFVAR